MPEDKTKNLENNVNEEAEDRIKNISTVSSSIIRMKNEMNDKILEMKQISDTEGMEQISKNTSRVLNKLSETIGNLSTGVKTITVNTAKATSDSIKDYGKAISEDISFNKQNVVSMALSRTSPIFGYFAGKFMETEVFKKASQRIKDELGNAISVVATKFKGAMASSFGKVKDVFSGIGSKLFGRKKVKVAPEPKEKAEENPLFRKAMTVKEEEEDKEKVEKRKEKLQKMKIKALKKVPSAQVGGIVEKGGLAKVHAGEVITPVDKLLSRMDEANEVAEKSSRSIVDTMNYLTLYNNRFQSYQIKQASKDRKGLVTDIFKTMATVNKEFVEETTNVENAILDLRNKLVGLDDRWAMAWNRLLLRHPVFRTLISATKGIVSAATFLPRWAFKSRGGYKSDLPGGTNTQGNMLTVLGMIYAGQMYRLDQIVEHTRETAVATRDTSKYISGEEYGEMGKGLRDEWSIARKALRVPAAPLEWLAKKALPSKAGAALTKEYDSFGAALSGGLGLIGTGAGKGIGAAGRGIGRGTVKLLPKSVQEKLEQRAIRRRLKLEEKERLLLEEAKAKKPRTLMDAVWELVEVETKLTGKVEEFVDVVGGGIKAIATGMGYDIETQKQIPARAPLLLPASTEEKKITRREKFEKYMKYPKAIGRLITKEWTAEDVERMKEKGRALGTRVGEKIRSPFVRGAKAIYGGVDKATTSISTGISKTVDLLRHIKTSSTRDFKEMREQSKTMKKQYATMESVKSGVNKVARSTGGWGKKLLRWGLGIVGFVKSFFGGLFGNIPKMLIGAITRSGIGKALFGFLGKTGKGAAGIATTVGKKGLGFAKKGLTTLATKSKGLAGKALGLGKTGLSKLAPKLGSLGGKVTGVAGKVGGKAASFLGGAASKLAAPITALAMTAYGASKAQKEYGDVMGKMSLGEKIGVGAGKALKGMTFGLLDVEKLTGAKDTFAMIREQKERARKSEERLLSKMSPAAQKLIGTQEGVFTRLYPLLKSKSIFRHEGQYITAAEAAEKGIDVIGKKKPIGMDEAIEKAKEGVKVVTTTMEGVVKDTVEKSKAAKEIPDTVADSIQKAKDEISDPKNMENLKNASTGFIGSIASSISSLKDKVFGEKSLFGKFKSKFFGGDKNVKETLPLDGLPKPKDQAVEKFASTGLTKSVIAKNMAMDKLEETNQLIKANLESSKQLATKVAEVGAKHMGEVVSNVSNVMMSSQSNNMNQSNGTGGGQTDIDPGMNDVIRDVLYGNLT